MRTLALVVRQSLQQRRQVRILADRDDDIHAHRHQLSRERSQSIDLPVGEPSLDDQILPLDVPEIAQRHGDERRRRRHRWIGPRGV